MCQHSSRKRGVTVNNNKLKVHPEHLYSALEYVDVTHTKRQAVTIRKIGNHLTNHHHLTISRTHVRFSMKKLGLSYKPIKAKQ